MNASVEILPIDDGHKAQLKTFLDVPYRLYHGHPAWHPPLRFERADQISRSKNPNAQDLDRQLFIARRGADVVGRIAAFLNPCLLYTSPSPRDQRGSRMPSSA